MKKLLKIGEKHTIQMTLWKLIISKEQHQKTLIKIKSQ